MLKWFVIGCLSVLSSSSKADCVTLPASIVHFSICCGCLPRTSFTFLGNIFLSAMARCHDSLHSECTFFIILCSFSDLSFCPAVFLWKSWFQASHNVSNILNVSIVNLI